MKVKHLFGPAVLALALLAPATGAAAASEGAPILTGQQWSQSDPNLKKAYLLGMANLLQVEQAYQRRHAPTDAQSLVPRFAKGLQTQTLDSVRESLDNWYAANPTRMDRPVVETLWFEIVVPGTKRAR
ncbi:hypothetical protein C1I89_01820 [Achromobacter pulmonis]|uniref:Uncharacterized protein n=1 Tax=Achromobacter pulmonis TaxID=1389932 RepID=A0A2N8KNX8_9BURK|nr:hypothetical protein [Achromobacter pulmonis]MBO9331812.1 hypothetical protein [Achromobacter xylosoxidans]PND35156.1 hypothetical protein C1I89_01820 [Achromobacter pulmonis]